MRVIFSLSRVNSLYYTSLLGCVLALENLTKEEIEKAGRANEHQSKTLDLCQETRLLVFESLGA
jgi:hypothetical protein